MFGATFNLVTHVATCRTAIIFGTLKDDSLLINTLTSNNCLCHCNVFQIGVNPFSKMVDPDFFAKKAQNYVYFLRYDFVRISPACDPNAYQIIYGETLDFQCQG